MATALLMAVAVLLALSVVEAFLRLTGTEYPEFYTYDPVLGSKLRPGLQGLYIREGKGYVRINSDSFRGREYSLLPPPDTLRIAVLGDSFTEGKEVHEEETFCAILEKHLRDCPHVRGREVEVLNFGQSGMGTARELLVWRHRAAKYSPHLVVLAFFTGNDVADNSPHFQLYPYHPYFILQNGELLLKDEAARETWEKMERARTPLIRLKHWLFDHLRVLQVLREGRKAWEGWWQRPRLSQAGQEPGIELAVFSEPRTGVWQEAWELTEALLRQFRREVTAAGSRFFLVVLTHDIQVHPDSAWRSAMARHLGVPDLLYPDRRLEKFCQQEGIPVLLLAPAFQEIATQKRIFFHGFGNKLGSGHWNQAGHRLAGELLARWLCQQLP